MLKNKSRFIVFSGIMTALCIALILTLGNLTIAQGVEYSEKSESRSTRTITLKGLRGNIYDRNGLPMAYDEKCYDVHFYKDPSKNSTRNRAYYTQVIIDTIEIIERNGGKVIDGFSLLKAEDGSFYFKWERENLTSSQKLTEAQKQSREKLWRGNFYLSEDLSKEEAYVTLRNRYQIPKEYTYEQAIKVLSVWQEVQAIAFRAFEPVVIAQNVNMQTVAEIETRSMELEGMRMGESSKRIYPRGETAAHVVGYIGRQYYTSERLAEMLERGYSESDKTGIEGVEATMEAYLTGNTLERQGKRVIEVNNRGKETKELSYDAPKAGHDVILTIDMGLQKKTEEALAKNISDIRAEQERLYAEKTEEYDEKVAVRGGAEIMMAQMGSAVVIDVNNGDVLSLANYPSYDPNAFIEGMTTEEYTLLAEDERKPLFNKAVNAGTPGSIFKMVTALAGLMEQDITVSERIDDKGHFVEHITNPTEAQRKQAPRCWQHNYTQHQQLDVVGALEQSCNYYFYTVAHRMGITLLDKWADNLGLTNPTGIEITGEVSGKVGNQKVLYDNTKSLQQQMTAKPILVQKQVKSFLSRYCDELNLSPTAAALDEAANKLVELVDERIDIGAEIRSVMADVLDIHEAVSYSNRWDAEISSSLSQIRWSPNDTIVSGIGQGVTTVTPVGVARYVSALVNGGTVYDLHVVKKIVDIDGNTVKEMEPVVNMQLDIPIQYINAIKEGMKGVINPEDRGTAANYFADWTTERINEVGAKTGTGQVSKIDLENNAWFVAFTPYDKPEIAVVVHIPNGYSGGMASYTAKEIIQYYLDQKELPQQEAIPVVNDFTE
ncbi:MAG: penicillin-binding transpeptidase domain-containing protein [Christensenellales bacterium]|jgi:penicillin-binding protein 2